MGTRALLLVCALMVVACGGGGGGSGGGGGGGGSGSGSGSQQTGNQAPTANAGRAASVNAGATVTLDGSQSRDAESGSLSYSWQLNPARSDVALRNANSANPTFTAPAVTVQTELAFTLTVTDAGGRTDTASVTITINASSSGGGDNGGGGDGGGDNGSGGGNDNGGGDNGGGGGSDNGGGDNGNGGSDNGGGGGDNGGSDNGGGGGDNGGGGNGGGGGDNGGGGNGGGGGNDNGGGDNGGGSNGGDTGGNGPSSANQDPVARTGGNANEGSGTVVALDGSRSTDPDGDGLRYAWTPTSGADFTLSGANTNRATFTAPIVTTNTPITFTLTVTDGRGGSDTATVTVTVLANRAPTADAGRDDTVTAGRTFNLNGSGSTDPERNTLTYAWRQTSGLEVSVRNPTRATASFAAPADSLSVIFTFELTVRDPGGLTAKDTVSITVAGDDVHAADDHEGSVHGIAISTDGSLAVSGGLDGTVRLWRPITGAEIRFDDGSGGARPLGRHTGAVYAVAMSGDGRRAISGGHDGTLKLWNTDMDDATGYGNEITYGNGANTRSLGEAGIWIYAVALNTDGTRAISGGLDGAVRLWNTATTGTGAGAEIMRFGMETTDRSLGQHFFITDDKDNSDPTDDDTHPVSVYAVDISDTGDRALSGGADGVVRVWNTDTGMEERKLTVPGDTPPATLVTGPIFGVDLSSDGATALAASADNKVHRWNAGTGDHSGSFDDDGADVTGVAMNAAADRVLSSGGDGFMRLRMNDGVAVHAVRLHTDAVWSAALSGDGAIAASAGNDGLIHFWATGTTPADTSDAFISTVLEIVPSGDSANWSGTDVVTEELDHGAIVRTLDLSTDGKLLASGGSDALLKLWNVDAKAVTRATGRREMRHSRSLTVWGVALRADGRLAVSVGDDDAVRVWDATTGTQLHESNAHGADVRSVVLTPDGGIALSGGRDGKVFSWDTNTGLGQETATTPAHGTDIVWSTALSANALLAVTGGDDDVLRVWVRDAVTAAFGARSTHAELNDSTMSMVDITDVALSVDGRLAVSSSKDTGTTNTPYMRVWNVTGSSPGLARRMERHHTDEVLAVDLTPDGRLALSGSRDHTVRLWDVATGALLRTMTGHGANVSSVTMSADGRIAASGEGYAGADKMRVWRIGRGHAGAPSRATARASVSPDNVAMDAAVTLDGSGSTDADGGAVLAYSWRQTSGPMGTLSGVSGEPARSTFAAAAPSPIGPAPTATHKPYKFELTVTDRSGLIATARVSAGATASTTTMDSNVESHSLGSGSDAVDKAVHAVAVSRNSQLVVSGGSDGRVRMHDAYFGSDPSTNVLGSHAIGTAVRAVAVSADGSRAISAGDDGAVRLWNTQTRTEITYAGGRSLGRTGAWAYAVAISADGRHAVSGGFDGRVRLYDTTTGEEKVRFGSETTDRSLGVHGGNSVYALAISDDGGRVLSGGSDRRLYLWETDSGAGHEIGGLDGQVFGVALSGDGNLAVSGGADNKVHLWNVANLDAIAELRELVPASSSGDVTSVALSTDKTRVLSGHGNSAVILWDANSGDAIRASGIHTDYVWSVALRNDGLVALSAGNDGEVRWWDTAKDVMPRDATLTEEADLAANASGTVGRRVIHNSDAHGFNSRTAAAITVNADGTVVGLSGSKGWGAGAPATRDRVVIWDLEAGSQGSVLHRLTAHVDGTTDLAVSADGSVAASLGRHEDGLSGRDVSHLRIWNVSTGSRDASYRFDEGVSGTHNRPYHIAEALAMSANGRRVMVGEKRWYVATSRQPGDIKIRVWDWDGSTLTGAFPGGSNDIGHGLRAVAGGSYRGGVGGFGYNDVALNEDGSIAMSGAEESNNNLRFWDVNAAQANRPIHAVSTGDNVNGVALSDDGKVGVSGHGSGTNSIRIWDRNGRTVTQRNLPSMDLGRDVQRVAITRNGGMVLAGGDDGYLKLWDAVTGIRLHNLKRTINSQGHGDNTINGVSLTPDGQWAFTVSNGTHMRRWHFRGRSRPVTPPPPSEGSAPPSLTGAAPRSVSAATPDAGGTCAALGGGDGSMHGQARGANCVYPASLLGTDNPIQTDTTIPALPGGGAHVFRHSLVVGSGRAGDETSAAAPPTLTIEAGAVLAFEGASSGLIVNPGARLLAVGTPDKPITLTSADDAQGWGGLQIHSYAPVGVTGTATVDARGTASVSAEVLDNPDTRAASVSAEVLDNPDTRAASAGAEVLHNSMSEHHLEFIVVKHTGSSEGAIRLHNVGSTTVVRNLQTYAAAGDGLALIGGAVQVQNFVSVYAQGNSIAIDADWSGSLRNALVIQPRHGGEHCLDVGGEAQGTISGLTCITAPHAGTDASRGLGAGIRLGANAAATIERSMVVGTFADDTDARLNYCLHIIGEPAPTPAPVSASPTLVGNVFACEDKTGGNPMPNGTTLAKYLTSRNNQFADVEAPTDPTAATDTQLQLLDGTPPVYSLDYEDLRINGTDTTVTPPNGADFPGAASQSATPSWLRPNGIDWTYGIFEGSRPEPLWFEPAR